MRVKPCTPHAQTRSLGRSSRRAWRVGLNAGGRVLPRGRLVVISAPSGCGKTTIIRKLVAARKSMERSISATTRKPRRGEVDGRDYYFLSRQEFMERRRNKAFLETARIFGHYYGTFRKAVLARLDRGRDVVLAIDIHGARQVRKKVRGVFIFIMPPSLEDLENRLVGRRRDPLGEIQKRLRRAQAEIACSKDYDYIVTNRYVGETVKTIETILEREKKKNGQL